MYEKAQGTGHASASLSMKGSGRKVEENKKHNLTKFLQPQSGEIFIEEDKKHNLMDLLQPQSGDIFIEEDKKHNLMDLLQPQSGDISVEERFNLFLAPEKAFKYVAKETTGANERGLLIKN